MKLTTKAKKEIKKLVNEINELEKKIERLREKMYTVDLEFKKMYSREIYKTYEKIDNKKEKINEIRDTGYSTSELATIKRNLDKFEILDKTKSIGSATYTVAGYVPSLKQHLLVKYIRYSSFFRNVKGCSSIAGTRDIISVKPITKTEYERLIKG